MITVFFYTKPLVERELLISPTPNELSYNLILSFNELSYTMILIFFQGNDVMVIACNQFFFLNAVLWSPYKQLVRWLVDQKNVRNDMSTPLGTVLGAMALFCQKGLSQENDYHMTYAS